MTEPEPEPAESWGACSGCGSLTFSVEWYKAFHVTLCTACKRDEELIPKGTAKELYLVTDADLRKLGSLSKANPQNREWTAMRLYLQSQVEALAHAKHGGPEGIEALRGRQNATREQNRLKRRTSRAQREAEEEARQSRAKRKVVEGAVPHKPIGEKLNADTGNYERTYDDGTTVEVERI